jgi:drug/metabolite transporter (DMT)-like permease
MPLSANLLGIILALTSAFVWGAGDFTGGYASRRNSQFHVLAISACSGLVVMIVAAVFWRETFPSMKGIVWSMLGGVSGALGIAALYHALSTGQAASIAPTSAVISAALPVVFGVFTEGLPTPVKLIGFGLALAGIWLVSSTSTAERGLSRRSLRLACIAGIGFGGFFIFLGQVDPGKIFTPLIIARSLTLCTGVLLVKLNRLPLPSLTSNPLALLAGVLDAGGNLFYILSKQYVRLDIAAVLASLYPASTVLLASIILHEKVSYVQWIGVLICLAAIVFITI